MWWIRDAINEQNRHGGNSAAEEVRKGGGQERVGAEEG
jgi:hypothetical protein